MSYNSFFCSLCLLLRSLLVTGAGQFFRCLPVNLIRYVLAGLSLALLVWTLLIQKEWLQVVGADLAATVLFLFYGAAGVLWGVQRALDEAGSEAIRTLEAESTVLFDSLLDGILIRRG